MKKNKIKKFTPYFLAFFIPFFVLLIIFLCLRVGFKETTIISDMQAQYVSLLNYLKNALNGTESIFYSFRNGFGSSMLGTIAYYLSSPLNIIMLFFNTSNLYIGIILITLIKFGLSGLTMYSFLKYNNKDSKYILIFSTCYALMIFSLAYFFHIMWLDAIILIPLVMLGIDKIVDNKSSFLYGITLFLTILTNYYMGYMVCIFSCIYFLYKLILKFKNKKDCLKKIIKFGIVSILAGFMTTFILIPTLLELINSIKNSNVNIFTNFTINFNYLNIFKQAMSGEYGYDNILNDKYQLIYCGVINVFLALIYFFNKNIKTKEKILTGIVYLIFLLSFTISPLNYIWHGFNIPVFFEYRYAYIFVLFNIYIACRCFNNLKNVNIKWYLITYLIIIILDTFVLANGYTIYNYAIFAILSLYILIIYLLNNYKDIDRIKDLKYILVVLVIGELFYSGFTTLRDYQFTPIEEYQGYTTIVGDQIEKIKEKDDNFYRIEKTFEYSSIDSFLLNYNGISSFLSTLERNILLFTRNVGFISYSNAYQYSNTSAFLDSIFNIKYIIDDSKENKNYNIIDSFDYSTYPGILYNASLTERNIYQNDRSLNIAFMIDNPNNYIEYLKEHKVVDNLAFQNTLSYTMNQNEVFKKLDYQKNEEEYLIPIVNQNDIYLDLIYQFNSKDEFLEVYVNDEIYCKPSFANNDVVVIKNNYNINDIIKIRIKKINEDIYLIKDIYPYYFDNNEFDNFYNTISKNQLNIESFTNTSIKGTINVDDKTTLFTSIPYNKGWSILVDGKKVETQKLYDTFLGANLTNGNHSIELKYYPEGLNIGIIISFISMMLFGIYIKFEKKIVDIIMNIYNKYEEIIDYLIVGVLTTIISILAYALFAKVFNVDYMISNIISWIISVIFAYFANKIVVFKSNIKKLKEIIKEAYQFIKYRLLSLIIDVGFMYLLVSIMNINDMISKIIVQIIVVILNYIFSKLFVFKKDSKK